jgi:hypothetical protein
VSPEVDRFEIGLTEDRRGFECLEVLELSYLDSGSDDLRRALNALSWELLAARLDGFEIDARRRALSRSRAAEKYLALPQDHLRTTAAIAASLRDSISDESPLGRHSSLTTRSSSSTPRQTLDVLVGRNEESNHSWS